MNAWHHEKMTQVRTSLVTFGFISFTGCVEESIISICSECVAFGALELSFRYEPPRIDVDQYVRFVPEGTEQNFEPLNLAAQLKDFESQDICSHGE